MTSSRRTAVRALAGLMIVSASFAAPQASADFPCFAPWVETVGTVASKGHIYSMGDETTLFWSGFEAGGWEIQVATDAGFENVVRTISEIGADEDEWTIDGLEERQHFYRVRSLALPGECSTGQWSETVAVIQDATGPEVRMSAQQQGVCGIDLPPTPTPVFCMSDVWLTGVAIDRPGGSAPSAVGPGWVSIALQSTTPLVGGGEPIFKTVTVGPGGEWLFRLKGDEKPPTGTYTATAIGIDKLQNINENAAILAFIVIL